MQHVAARFPQLCEAETEVFSRLLGVHVQRLATLARGAHVCTTHVPARAPAAGGPKTTSGPTTAQSTSSTTPRIPDGRTAR